MKYKHYSFDLWQTLIRSNPDFKLKRAEYFFNHFNRQNKSIDEVISIIRDIDIMCNSTNEVVGANIHAYEMYTMILHKLGYDLSPFTQKDIQSICNIVEVIFLNNPPVLYDQDTLNVLKELKSSGATISILSNTAFIQGVTLRKFIETELKDIFLFQMYSDETGSSKPNKKMFIDMMYSVYRFRLMSPITQQHIVHVGDNIISDIGGATNIGLDSIQINTNHKTIKDLLWAK